MAKRRPKKAKAKKRAPAAKRPASRAGLHTADLRAADLRAIEVALAGIAHDIRTPLTGIVALAELLAASDLGKRERGWANAVKSGAEHLATLSSLIVDAVKADATRLILREEPFSPRALAAAVGEALTARAGNKGISAKITIAPDLPEMALGDAVRLRAALENLADNAVKFTNQGMVAFTASCEAATRGRLRLVFTVVDSGIGISPADLKKLFRPFAQASEQIARRYGGAGLGLTFVKRIAKVMGGDLKVVSKAGAGSTFRLTALVTPASERRAGDAPRVSPSRALSLLCAEDNPYGRVVMNTILTQLGHKVDFVESGETAVAAAARGGYDALLMDVTLPGFDGLEATRRIRALPGKAGQVLVIGVSGRGEAAHQNAALAAGMNFYFVKPVSPSKLAQALATVDA